jgi:hypothetical protein
MRREQTSLRVFVQGYHKLRMLLEALFGRSDHSKRVRAAVAAVLVGRVLFETCRPNRYGCHPYPASTADRTNFG